MKKIFTIISIFSCFYLFGQEDMGEPTDVDKMEYLGKVSSISSRRSMLLLAITEESEALDGKSRPSKVVIVPGKDLQKEADYFVRHRNALSQKNRVAETKFHFDAYQSSVTPTDPSLAVGPDHVFVVFNTGFIIYDKQGKALTSQLNPSAIFSAGYCDLTASYDNAAERWVVSILAPPSSGAQVAVSDSPDPVNCNWYIYRMPGVVDYQKLSIWSDGYYVTENSTRNKKVWALERDKMLKGDPNAKIIGFSLPGLKTLGFLCPQALNVSNGDMPAPGNAPIVYMQDDGWYGVSQDHIKVWSCNVDWSNPQNSSMSNPKEIPTKPFIGVFDGGNMGNLPQPNGVRLDALQSTIMNQAQFRKFPDHNSAIFHFVVNVGGSYGKLAGIRWVELRQSGDGEPWTLYQEDTYTAPNGKHAWQGSMMMDGSGNITLGYTAMSGPSSSKTVHVSSYFTGRYVNDPLGTMTVEETLIAKGSSDIPGNNGRYGDYCKVDIDPNNDKTFYFINEYANGEEKAL